jgi:ATP-dependent Clp protease ATP-binding subunit ClpA
MRFTLPYPRPLGDAQHIRTCRRQVGRAKKVLELSLREAVRLHHEHIADGHILLGLLLEREGLAVRILVDAGVDLDSLRRDVTATLE